MEGQVSAQFLAPNSRDDQKNAQRQVYGDLATSRLHGAIQDGTGLLQVPDA